MKDDNVQNEVIAREAKVRGYIKIFDLVGILAAEDSYIQIIPKLIKEFPQLTLKLPSHWHTYQNRVIAWMCLFRRWAGLEPNCIKNKLKGISFLNCYVQNKINGKFYKVDRNQNIPDYFNDFLKLDELKDYLKNIEYIFQIKIALPLIFCSDEISACNFLPCEPGTKWEDVKITLVDDNVVKIETPRGDKRLSYHQLGMTDDRTRKKKSNTLWALLKLFAQNQGSISRQNPNYDSKLPDTAKRLNKLLQQQFGIDESIFIGHYKTLKGYKTKIFFSDQTQVIQ